MAIGRRLRLPQAASEMRTLKVCKYTQAANVKLRGILSANEPYLGEVCLENGDSGRLQATVPLLLKYASGYLARLLTVCKTGRGV